MLKHNPSRMDYQQNHEEIVADYNREKDRVTIEETFRWLTELINELDAEQKRAVEEGLNEDELALFDLLKKDNLAKAERERVKQASRNLLASIKDASLRARPLLGKGTDQGGCRGSRYSLSTRYTPACRRRPSPPRRRRRPRPRSMRMSGNRPLAVNWQGWRDGPSAYTASR